MSNSIKHYFRLRKALITYYYLWAWMICFQRWFIALFSDDQTTRNIKAISVWKSGTKRQSECQEWIDIVSEEMFTLTDRPGQWSPLGIAQSNRRTQLNKTVLPWPSRFKLKTHLSWLADRTPPHHSTAHYSATVIDRVLPLGTSVYRPVLSPSAHWTPPPLGPVISSFLENLYFGAGCFIVFTAFFYCGYLLLTQTYVGRTLYH